METVSNIIDQAFLKSLEERIVAFVLDDNHIYLFLGLISIMALLRYVPYFQKVVFTESRKWLAAPINVALSVVGVFLLSMTPATTTGLKIVVVAVESTLATFLYEAALKRLISMVQSRLEKYKNGDAAPPTV
ncbi:MAG: hypothetical protein WC444_05095 [Candidatus Paceibacterota bacterium]